MQISEIFHSLQGEGPHLGEPHVFIRLSGCIEPYCPWCDTAYAWHEGIEMTPGEIMTSVKYFSCRRIAITGGEPFLQWDSGLETLHGQLSREGFTVSYETSGKAGIPDMKGALVIVSPKHIKGIWRISPTDLKKADFYKFVAEDNESLEDIHAFIKNNVLPREKVYIMPMGRTRREQLDRLPMVFGFCRDKGYALTPRLHILAFDACRGV